MTATTPADRASWLRHRRAGLGASEVSAVLGLSPWATPWDVWVAKTDPTAPDRTETAVQARGNWLEAAVLDWMEHDAGRARRRLPARTLLRGPEAWTLCTPDDLYAVDGWGMEAKTSRVANEWGSAGDPNGVPIHYEIQCRWSMYVADASRWDIGVYLPIVDDWRRYTLERDHELEQVMVARCRDWWRRHIEDLEIPDMDGSPAARGWLTRQHPRPVDNMRAATSDEELLVRSRVQVAREIGDLELQRDDIDNRIRAAIADHEGLLFRGGKATWLADKNGKRTLRCSVKPGRS